MSPKSTSLEEYYLWRRKVEKQYPWQRQFTNAEFLKYEEKRIRDCEKWYKKFVKSEINTSLDSVSFYAVPITLSTSWKAAIADFGNYKYIGLSALFNSPSVMVTALIPNTEKQPREYSLIEITKSKRINIINKRSNKVVLVTIIEDWEYLESDKIYTDVPYEKNIIQKVIKENLINDSQISSSLQSPIISAPYVYNSIGGLSISSISQNSTFAKDLLEIIQLMVPPEYRNSNPPKSAYKGHAFPFYDGIQVHLAERPHSENNILSILHSKEYIRLETELSKRNKFKGEFSIFSTFSPDECNVTQIWKELMKKFTATEVTLPIGLDELNDDGLFGLRNDCNEDMWIQVVHAHQLKPDINADSDKNYINIINLLRNDLDIILSDIIKKDGSREYLINSMLYDFRYNLKRLAQSIARANENEKLDGKYLKKARDLIIDNFSGLINHPKFRLIKLQMESKKEDARYSVVQTEIINHPRSSTNEIYENVKNTKFFEDVYDLQGLLDWIDRKGHVIIDSNQRYTWIGKVN